MATHKTTSKQDYGRFEEKKVYACGGAAVQLGHKNLALMIRSLAIDNTFVATMLYVVTFVSGVAFD